MKKFTFKMKLWLSLAVLAAISTQTIAQRGDHDVILDPGIDLQESIVGDTLDDGSRRDPLAVYVLQRSEVYRIANPLFLDFNLELVGEEGSGMPAFVLPMLNALQTLPVNYFNVAGNNVSINLSNIIFQGLPSDYEHMVTGLIVQTLVQESGDSVHLVIDNCIINGFSGYIIWDQSIGAYAKLTNNIVRNIGSDKDAWGGGGIAHWGSVGAMDSIILQNNSFINTNCVSLQAVDDIYRYMSIEHNTFIGSITGFQEVKLTATAIYKDNIFVGQFSEGMSKDEVQYWPPLTDDGLNTTRGPSVFTPDTVKDESLTVLQDLLGMQNEDRIFTAERNLCYWPDKLTTAWQTLDSDGGAVLPIDYVYPFFRTVIDGYPNMNVDEGIFLDPGFEQATIDRIFDPIIDWTNNL